MWQSKPIPYLLHSSTPSITKYPQRSNNGVNSITPRSSVSHSRLPSPAVPSSKSSTTTMRARVSSKWTRSVRWTSWHAEKTHTGCRMDRQTQLPARCRWRLSYIYWRRSRSSLQLRLVLFMGSYIILGRRRWTISCVYYYS
jgi:hypothetical protein